MSLCVVKLFSNVFKEVTGTQPKARWSLGTHGRIGGRIEEPKGDRNSTGKPKESNLDPWDPQSLNHPPKNIHRLDPGLSAHM